MNPRQRQNHFIDVLFTLGLLCVFAASALAVVLIGAHVYQSTAADMDANYTTRTSLSYVAEKVRQHNESGSISLGKIQDRDALILLETIEDKKYATYIYEDEGYLKELFIQKDKEPKKSQGESILEVTDFTIQEVSRGFFRFTATDRQKHSLSLLIHVQSE